MGSVAMVPTVTTVPLARSRTTPGSRVITLPRCSPARRTLRQHRRGWAGGLYFRLKAFLHRMCTYVRTHMPAAQSDRAKWQYHSPRWKRGIGRSAFAAVWAQDRRRRPRGEKFIVYELLFTLRRTQGAIGDYEGPTGAAVAASGRLRRHGRCRRRIPGVGLSLIHI